MTGGYGRSWAAVFAVLDRQNLPLWSGNPLTALLHCQVEPVEVGLAESTLGDFEEI
jgi:hypothetical protein